MPELSEELTNLVRRELYILHVPPNLRGHHYLVYIVERVAVTPLRIKNITKDLYPETAHNFGTDWKAVERNSRTAILACWKNAEGRERLNELAGYQFIERPKTTTFAAIVASHVTEEYQGMR